MLKFKTSCAVHAYLSSNLLNEVFLSLFRYFEVGLRVCDVVVKKLTFAISSPDEFLYMLAYSLTCSQNVSDDLRSSDFPVFDRTYITSY